MHAGTAQIVPHSAHTGSLGHLLRTWLTGSTHACLDSYQVPSLTFRLAAGDEGEPALGATRGARVRSASDTSIPPGSGCRGTTHQARNPILSIPLPEGRAYAQLSLEEARTLNAERSARSAQADVDRHR